MTRGATETLSAEWLSVETSGRLGRRRKEKRREFCFSRCGAATEPTAKRRFHKCPLWFRNPIVFNLSSRRMANVKRIHCGRPDSTRHALRLSTNKRCAVLNKRRDQISLSERVLRHGGVTSCFRGNPLLLLLQLQHRRRNVTSKKRAWPLF